jgi:hypothetical protein
MGSFARFVRVLTVGRSLGLPLMVSVIVPVAAQAQGNMGTKPTQQELEAQIATLKAETAALVVSARLEALSQQLTLLRMRPYGQAGSFSTETPWLRPNTHSTQAARRT